MVFLLVSRRLDSDQFNSRYWYLILSLLGCWFFPQGCFPVCFFLGGGKTVVALFCPAGKFYGILISVATWNSREKNISIAEGKVFHRREDINVFHQDLLSSLGMGEKVSREFLQSCGWDWTTEESKNLKLVNMLIDLLASLAGIVCGLPENLCWSWSLA